MKDLKNEQTILVKEARCSTNYMYQSDLRFEILNVIFGHKLLLFSKEKIKTFYVLKFESFPIFLTELFFSRW